MATIDLTADSFSTAVEKDGITLVDFWAPWCGPCRAFGPIFERASEKHPGITFAKVNTEEEQELAGGLGIQSIPTLMLFRDRVLLFAEPGMLPEPVLDELIEKAKALDMDEVRRKVQEANAAQA